MENEPEVVSYAQNREDVVLSRALRTIQQGTYVDIGANHPTIDSVSFAFYRRGWSGLLVEPSPGFVRLLEAERPRDIVAPVVAGSETGTAVLHVIADTGLSTTVDAIADTHARDGYSSEQAELPRERISTLLSRHGFDSRDIHFMSIDTEGAERDVLLGVDFSVHRPWVMVIEATAPRSTEQVHGQWEGIVLNAGYSFCLFDGLSRFYVADERRESLAESLSYPACVFDRFITADEQAQAIRIVRLESELAVARNELEAVNQRLRGSDAAIEAITSTVSWRITRGLRSIRSTLSRPRS